MVKNNHFVHGGDVQAMECVLPSGVKKIEHKPIALGEHSGHMHVVTGPEVALFEDKEGNIYGVTGSDGATLQHVHESLFDGKYDSKRIYSKADHNPVTLKPKTTYKFGIHKKYNPFQKVWEKVQD